MGIIRQGILGGFAGTVGAVVGSSWKGIATMRSRPLSVTNPRTNAQVNNRTNFKALSALGSSLLSGVIKPLNDRFAQRMSGFNQFMTWNSNVFSDNGASFDGANLVLSRGRLGVTPLDELLQDGSSVTIAWRTVIQGSFQNENDRAYIVILDSDANVLAVSSGAKKRSEANATLNLGRAMPLNSFIYISFLREDGTQVGDTSVSVYRG